MKFKSTFPSKIRIEIIPMIDIMFFLLVCFMILAFQSETHKTIRIRLPDSLTAKKSQEKAVFIQIMENGSLFINDTPITKKSLGHTLVKIMQNHLDQSVVIQADQHTHVHTIITVMDLARKVGVNKFALATY